MLDWLSASPDLPPIDVAALCENFSKPLTSALSELFDLKRTCQEGDLINRQAVLDDFVHQALVEKAPRPLIASVDPATIKIADDIFQRLLEFKVPEQPCRREVPVFGSNAKSSFFSAARQRLHPDYAAGVC